MGPIARAPPAPPPPGRPAFPRDGRRVFRQLARSPSRDGSRPFPPRAPTRLCLGEPVAAQAAALEASVAAGAEGSVLVSVEALYVAAAREVAQGVVGTGLERVGRSGRAVAVIVFAEDGRVAYRRSESS